MMLELCENRQEWDDFVLENNGHPLQLWGWGELKQAHGWRADRLVMIDDGKIVAGASVLIKKLPWPFRSLAYIPRGPIAGDNNRSELLETVYQFITKKYHSVAVTIEPDMIDFQAPKSWAKSANHILPAATILLDLTKSEDDLMSDMAKKTRQYIRKSSSGDFQIKMIKNKNELGKCLDIYHQTATRAGFPLHSDEYYYDVFSKLGDHSPVFAAYIDDQPIAFLWLAISADTAYELYGGMNEDGQRMRANYALKWHAIKKCQEWGLTRYDFGGLLDGGVTTFKMGWATGETRLAGTFDRPASALYIVWLKGLPLLKAVMRRLKTLLKR